MQDNATTAMRLYSAQIYGGMSQDQRSAELFKCIFSGWRHGFCSHDFGRTIMDFVGRWPLQPIGITPIIGPTLRYHTRSHRAVFIGWRITFGRERQKDAKLPKDSIPAILCKNDSCVGHVVDRYHLDYLQWQFNNAVLVLQRTLRYTNLFHLNQGFMRLYFLRNSTTTFAHWAGFSS